MHGKARKERHTGTERQGGYSTFRARRKATLTRQDKVIKLKQKWQEGVSGMQSKVRKAEEDMQDQTPGSRRDQQGQTQAF
jgi:hypothetical protein